MALALYRKYRPATFAEVVGQEHVTDPLRTALAAGRINHAYLFSGPRGCGKTSSARILARSLNCVQGPTADPCGVCPSCIALAPEGPGSLDVVELDAASHGGVDDTRELRDRAFYMPAESRYRVFIIDEAHMVTPQGFNALLKIVEEPPEHLVFIFATTEPDKVLTTIRSRTHHYPFRLIPPATLRALLERLCAEEGVTVEPAVFPLVIQAGGGSARDSLSVLDQLLAGAGEGGVSYRSAVALLGVTDAALLDEMVDALAAGDGASVFGVVDKVVEAGHDPRRFAADLLQRLRDLVILREVPEAAAKGLIGCPEDQLAAMAGQADRLGTATVTRYAEVLHTGLTEMRGTTSPRLVLELMCARMLLPAASLTDGALLQRLERMERRMFIAGEDPGPGTGEQSGPAAPLKAPSGVAAPVPTRPAPTTSDAAAAPAPETASLVAPPSAAPAVPVPETTAPATGYRRRSQAGETPGDSTATGRSAPANRSKPAGPDLGLPPPPKLSTRSSGSSPIAAATNSPATTTTGATRSVGPADSGNPNPTAAEPVGQPSVSARAEAEVLPTVSGGVAVGRVDVGRVDVGRVDVGRVDVTDVRRVWGEVLAAVQRQRRTTQILLESATVSAVADGALHLTMPSAGMARRVVESANADLLRDALRTVLGVEWAIRCTAANDPDAGAPATARRPSGQGNPAGRLGAESRSGPVDLVPPPDEEEIPDDYGDEPPEGAVAVIRDPHDAAIELLTAQLGAKQVNPGS